MNGSSTEGRGASLRSEVVLAAEDLSDGVAGEPGDPGDGADGVALAGQVADVHGEIHSDHGGPPRGGVGGDRGRESGSCGDPVAVTWDGTIPHSPTGWVNFQ